jgi:hypothetical protein
VQALGHLRSADVGGDEECGDGEEAHALRGERPSRCAR